MNFVYRSILAAALAVGFVFQAHAADVVLKKVTVLGNIAYGYSVNSVKGATAYEQLADYAVRVAADVDDFKEQYVKNPKDSDLSVADQSVWALITARQAKLMMDRRDAKYNTDGDEESKEKAEKNQKVAEAIIDELSGLGMKFGTNPSVSAYCGMTFGGILVFDVKRKKVYEIALTGSGSC